MCDTEGLVLHKVQSIHMQHDLASTFFIYKIITVLNGSANDAVSADFTYMNIFKNCPQKMFGLIGVFILKGMPTLSKFQVAA